MRRILLVAVALGAAGTLLVGASPAAADDPLTITPPADMTVVSNAFCNGTPCAVVSYAFTVSGGTPPYAVICNLPSPGPFLLGSHTISCMAQDAHDNSTPDASFTLTVTDSGASPPPPPPPPAMLAITPPADMTIQAASPCRENTYCAVLVYSYTITGGSPPYTLDCNFPSGSVLPVGSYTISCTGQDSEDDSTPPATFEVTVTAPPASEGGSGGSSYVPDVTGCAVSTCMGNSLSGFQIDGVTCDFGSFNWSRTSYACAGASTVSSPITLHAGNQTSDVSIAFHANGSAVAVASTAATGQQSGISYVSAPISLSEGTNTITATVDDPLGRLPAMVYTWTIDDPAPPTSASSGTSTDGSGSNASGQTTSGSAAGSGSSSSGGSAAAGGRPPAATVVSAPAAPPAKASAASPSIAASASGRRSLSFAVRLPRAGTVSGTLLTASGTTLLRFRAKERAGRTVIRRALPRQVRRGTRLTLRLVLRSGSATLKRTLRFRA